MHPRARRKNVHRAGRRAERREQHDVVRREGLVTGALVAAVQETDPELLESAVDARVVNDLALDEELLVGELLPRLIGVIDRPIDAVAKPEFLREVKGEVAGRQDEPFVGVTRVAHGPYGVPESAADATTALFCVLRHCLCASVPFGSQTSVPAGRGDPPRTARDVQAGLSAVSSCIGTP